MEMDGWTQGSYVNQTTAAGYRNGNDGVQKSGALKENQSAQDPELKNVGGRTIGNPKLSDKALKYYEQLKRKYGNMDFILVSPEMKEQAERMKGAYASNKELLVLIDSDKIERMAQDEEYRRKYEGILDSAGIRMQQMKKSLGANADRVKSYGMTFNDHGNASFFAVVDKSLALQRERIKEKHEENVKNKKEAAKKAEKEKAQEAAGESRTGAGKTKREDDDSVTVTASTWEELLEKINLVIENAAFEERSDRALTEQEKKLGQSIDYSL